MEKVKADMEREKSLLEKEISLKQLTTPKKNVRYNSLYNLSKKIQLIGKERRELIASRTTEMNSPHRSFEKNESKNVSPRLLFLYKSGERNIRTKRKLDELQKFAEWDSSRDLHKKYTTVMPS